MLQKLRMKMKDSRTIKQRYFFIVLCLYLCAFSVMFSYAIFTIRIEQNDRLAITTANLYSVLRSDDIDILNTIVVPANTKKNITLIMENPNAIDVKMNLSYAMINVSNNTIAKPNTVKVEYIGLKPPVVNGEVVLKPGGNNTRTYQLFLTNDSSENVIIKFTSLAGLKTDNLYLPDMHYEIFEKIESYLVKAENGVNGANLFLGGPFKRSEVNSIRFHNTMDCTSDGTLKGTQDVSSERNGSIVAKYYEIDTTNRSVLICSNDIIKANPDSKYLFAEMRNVTSIDLTNFDTRYATNMNSMFWYTGSNSTNFTLIPGDTFNTSNVENMGYMFYSIGSRATNFTLDLGNHFDTSKVINMEAMFHSTARNSPNFTLVMGDKFDTLKVQNMNEMFHSIGRNSPDFSLVLGDKFDTSNVKYMSGMFNNTGRESLHFTLDLGNKFDTRNVEDMSHLFAQTGYSNTNFKLNLGDKFDTSKVKTLNNMFFATGHDNENLIINAKDANIVINPGTNTTAMFRDSKPTQQIYLRDSDAVNSVNLVTEENDKWNGQLINCSETLCS